ALEALLRDLLRDDRPVQDLERELLVGVHVVDEEDSAHAPLAQLAIDPVPTGDDHARFHVLRAHSGESLPSNAIGRPGSRSQGPVSSIAISMTTLPSCRPCSRTARRQALPSSTARRN